MSASIHHPTITHLRAVLDRSPGPADGADLVGRRLAAVSLILRPASADMSAPASQAPVDVLLVRRALLDGDPWSGHMALPGGKIEKGDRDLIQTATRETEEEVGLSLDRTGEHLGRLSDLRPVSAHLPSISVTPHLFAVPERTDVRELSEEVDEALWVPLPELRNSGRHLPVTIEHRTGRRDFPAIHVDDRVVWGMTYRILMDFFQVLERMNDP